MGHIDSTPVMPTIYFIPLVAFSVVAMLVSMTHFNKLLRELYTNHHEQWKELGEPSSLFWEPPNTSPFKGYRTGRDLAALMLLFSPDWAKSDAALGRLCNIYRWSAWVSWICWLPIIAMWFR